MMPLRKKRLSAAALVLGPALLVLVVVLQRTPLGYFDSTTIMGHHAEDDVLSFSDGAVTWKTCCGDSATGTYSRSPDGTWLWQEIWGKKSPKTNVCILRPGVFSLTCIDAARPERVWTLKRRLFPPRTFDGHEN
jgi:hypothetical protein